jgi:glycosyltransferase involved in cell wall biosynthesis
MKNSKAASIIAYMEAKKWCKEKLETYTDVFICPSRFMAKKMAKGGYDEKKLKVLCNFIDTEKCKNNLYEKRDYYCYIGRLSNEKGIKTLIEAAKQLPLKLVVIGGGPLEKELKAKSYENVEFVGFKQWNDIIKLVGNARFAVVPSEWYENNPLSVIEAQCLGIPVLGAKIGGIPELIEEEKSGMTFESGNVNDLKEKILKMWNSTFDYKMIAEESQEKYNAESYYKELIKVYKNI